MMNINIFRYIINMLKIQYSIPKILQININKKKKVEKNQKVTIVKKDVLKLPLFFIH